jgi:hypothetical protein
MFNMFFYVLLCESHGTYSNTDPKSGKALFSWFSLKGSG